jgi:hypothetical protein
VSCGWVVRQAARRTAPAIAIPARVLSTKAFQKTGESTPETPDSMDGRTRRLFSVSKGSLEYIRKEVGDDHARQKPKRTQLQPLSPLVSTIPQDTPAIKPDLKRNLNPTDHNVNVIHIQIPNFFDIFPAYCAENQNSNPRARPEKGILKHRKFLELKKLKKF